MQSCYEIKLSNAAAASGEYFLHTAEHTVQAYCEMGLGGGEGFTFLNPMALQTLSPAELFLMVSKRNQALLYLRWKNGIQKYVIIQQLDQYKYTSLAAPSLIFHFLSLVPTHP